MTCYELSGMLSIYSINQSAKMSKLKIMQTELHDSPWTLVFSYQRCWRNLNGSPPMRAPNAGGVG